MSELTAPIIRFRKNSASSVSKEGKSIMILETKEKKITVNLKDDKSFLNKKDFPRNINLMKSSISNMESGHFSDRSLIRMKKQGENIPINDIENLDIENKDPNRSREMIKSQEVKIETSGDLKDEPLNIVEQCEQFQVDGVKLNSIESRETGKDRRLSAYSYNNQQTRSIAHIKVNNEIYQHNVILSKRKESNDLRSKEVNIDLVVKESEEQFEYFKLCFICDKLHLTTTTFTALGCEHMICLKCGKTFYEDKIEQGEYDLQCPIYKCPFSPNLEFIKILLSDKHVETLKNLLDRKDVAEVRTKSNTQLEVRVYTQKHVFDVNTNDTFFNYNKTKDQFCIKCGEPSLYGRTGKTYVKCLNCYNTICKFCMKYFTYDHLDITSSNYCKVYFRKTLKKQIEKESKFKIFLLTYIMMIPSYILFVLAMFSYISDIIKIILCKKEKIIFKIIHVFIMLLAIIILLPVFIIMIPYFPILIALFK
jgi:hypothetical protein